MATIFDFIRKTGLLVFFVFFSTVAFGQNKKIDVLIDATETRHPVSEHIYGQFIEHIGNIINHGMWAEMLDDRKFYYPILEEKPDLTEASFARQSNRWMATGSIDAIVMDESYPYAGKLSPKVIVSPTNTTGFWQDELHLIKDKGYTGRIVAAVQGDVDLHIDLIWGDQPDQFQRITLSDADKTYRTFDLSFKAGADTDNARLKITGNGDGHFWIGAVSLMPEDNIEGYRKEVIELLKSLNSGIYRFPGGNFVSAHEWRHAIGDRDKRPPIMDPHWGAVQPNDVGTDEFLTLTRILEVEPYITVNAGFGDAWSAAQLVEYVNGSIDTPMGKLRAENGHPEPYNVTYWGVGNEAWGSWQMGAMSLEQFVIKHNLFAEAMWEVDPDIKLIGSGAMPDAMTCAQESLHRTGTILTEYLGPADWTGGLFLHSLEYMDLISEHFYAYANRRFDIEIGEGVDLDPDEPLTMWMRRPANHIKTKIEAYEDYLDLIPELNDRKIPIALAEWAYAREPATSYKLVPAYAWAFNEMIRHSDLFYMANFTFATSLLSMNRTDAVLTPSGLLFKLYANHFGTIPVTVHGNSPQPEPVYPPGGQDPRVHAGSDTYPLDIVAAFSEDKKNLTIAVVNPDDKEHTIHLTFDGVQPGVNGIVRIMSSDDIQASNQIGQDQEVSIEERAIDSLPETLTFKPYSVYMYTIPVQ